KPADLVPLRKGQLVEKPVLECRQKHLLPVRQWKKRHSICPVCSVQLDCGLCSFYLFQVFKVEGVADILSTVEREQGQCRKSSTYFAIGNRDWIKHAAISFPPDHPRGNGRHGGRVLLGPDCGG